MAYSAEISRSNPSCFLFLVDQSGSMDEPLSVGGEPGKPGGRTKAQAVADAVNRLLQNLIIKCAKSEGVRDYYHVGVLGYGGDQTSNRVTPAFGGTLVGREMVPVSDIANNPARIEERSRKVEDGAGGLVEQKVKFPIWFDPIALGGTPMCQALTKAAGLLQNWIAQHPESFPPIVINITDGAATDGDPQPAAEELRKLSAADGSVLLFNIHISSTAAQSVEFPDSDAPLADGMAKTLFAMSSLLPAHMQAIASQEGLAANEQTRGFAFNADLVALIRFLDIGTRPSNLR